MKINEIYMMRIRPRNDEMHRHGFFELVYVVGGRATHHLEQERMTLLAGDYFIIDTGTEHCYRDTEDFEIINCLFMPEYIDRALTDCPTLAALLSNQVLRFGVPMTVQAADRIYHDTDGTVGRLMTAMDEEFRQRRVGYMELLRCHLTQSLVCALRAGEQAERPLHPAVTSVIEFLKKNYVQPLSLDALARAVGYTPSYLSGLFADQTGMSIRTFLQHLRIEQACRLLEQSMHPITQIAQQVGYGDPKHFTVIFRRIKGKSPREYRAGK
jgi:AraC-like DNA-binding protein